MALVSKTSEGEILREFESRPLRQVAPTGKVAAALWLETSTAGLLDDLDEWIRSGYGPSLDRLLDRMLDASHHFAAHPTSGSPASRRVVYVPPDGLLECSRPAWQGASTVESAEVWIGSEFAATSAGLTSR
jgi:hypothetical protein